LVNNTFVVQPKEVDLSILLNHYVILLLRVAHVSGAVLWVGSGIFLFLHVLPTARVTQAAGQKFMEALGPRVSPFMNSVATTTIFSGALLYLRFFVGGVDWIWRTGAGIGFTVGALAGISSSVIGVAILGPTQARIGALGAAMSSAGTSPKPEQVAEMNRLQMRQANVFRLDMLMLVLAMLAMATARYL
jgi:hypothetical protein